MDIRYGEMSEINPGGRKFMITDLLSGFHKFSVVFNIKVPSLPAQLGALFHILKHEKLNLSMDSHHNRLMNLYISFCKLFNE